MNKNIALMALTGILTLASCSQTPDTTDKTNPAVTLAANPTSLPKEGGPTTLTASASDNVAVTKVEFYRDGAKIGEDTTSPFTYVDTLAANATTSTKSYSYTAKAFDAAANSATSSAVAVTVAGTTPPPPPQGGDSAVVINVTSPANGATVDPAATQVAFNTSAALNNVKCTVDGVDVTATVSGNAGVCTVNLTGKTGLVAIKVSGTDANGKTAVGGTNVNIKTTPAVTITSPFKADQEIVPDASGKVNYDDAKFTNGAWRVLPQQIDSTSFKPVIYVRDVVGIDTTLPAGATRQEIWVSTTSDGPARLYLYDSQTGGTNAANVTLDSNLLDQGVLMYIVKRVYTASGSTTTSYPFIVDNSPTQSADPAISKGAVNSNLITNLGGTRDNNWARGTLNIYTSNTDLADKLGALPSGLDKITYYFVPAVDNNKITALPQSSDPQNPDVLQSRIAAIKKYATKKRVSEDKSSTGKWQTSYDSVAEGDTNPAGNIYYIYAVTTDQIGNEIDSTLFQKITFDNVGPSGASGLKDVSELPFASCDANKYISDWFQFSGSISDGGVGFGQNPGANASINLGTLNIPLNWDGAKGLYNSAIFDSNRIADGTYTTTTNLTDLLGNPGTFTNSTVIIDNTDPAVNWVSPAAGQLITSGTNVQVSTNIDTDSGAPLDTTRTRLFWNDYRPGTYRPGTYAGGTYPVEQANSTRTRALGYVGAPVEFANGKTTISSRGSRATWTALSPNAQQLVNPALPEANHNMNLVQLAVDCAGNASIATRTVNVNPNPTIKPAPLATQPGNPNLVDGMWHQDNLPTFGRWDVYANNQNPIYNTPVQQTLHRFSGTDSIYDISTASSQNPDGLFTADIAVNGTSSRAGSGAAIDEVNFYRQLDQNSWRQIVAWQTGKNLDGSPIAIQPGSPSLDSNYFYTTTGLRVDPTLYHNSGYGKEDAAQKSTLAAERGVEWLGQVDISTFTDPVLGAGGEGGVSSGFAAPWFNIEKTATSSAFYRLTANFKSQEHGASGLGAVVTDTLGLYSYTADRELSFTARNSTPADVLSKAHTAATSIPLQFTIGSWEKLTADAATNGYVLQGLVPGTANTWVDITATSYNPVTWSPTSVAAGTSVISAVYKVNLLTPSAQRYTQFRLRLGDAAPSDDTYYSDPFSLNITY